LRFYNNNKYKVSYYQDNEKIVMDDGGDDGETGDCGETGDAGGEADNNNWRRDSGTKGAKKPLFINDDDE
jgi:hypothetical protein